MGTLPPLRSATEIRRPRMDSSLQMVAISSRGMCRRSPSRKTLRVGDAGRLDGNGEMPTPEQRDHAHGDPQNAENTKDCGNEGSIASDGKRGAEADQRKEGARQCHSDGQSDARFEGHALLRPNGPKLSDEAALSNSRSGGKLPLPPSSLQRVVRRRPTPRCALLRI